jgi:hypothetical protein
MCNKQPFSYNFNSDRIISILLIYLDNKIIPKI